mmetsp:Transcript_37035/g.73297  ORF Transcript_37035/g.73297 Transcript_37035/m.73297 type:complete len:281 (+) Transcript_37035:24-866(+)
MSGDPFVQQSPILVENLPDQDRPLEIRDIRADANIPSAFRFLALGDTEAIQDDKPLSDFPMEVLTLTVILDLKTALDLKQPGYLLTAFVTPCQTKFVALKQDMSLETWAIDNGTLVEFPCPERAKRDIFAVFNSGFAFAAITTHKTVITWGEFYDSRTDRRINAAELFNTAFPTGLNKVENMRGTTAAFAAVHDDGNVSVWGIEEAGGKIPAHIQGEIDSADKITSIMSDGHAFAVVTSADGYLTWGSNPDGGDCSGVHDRLPHSFAVHENILPEHFFEE